MCNNNPYDQNNIWTPPPVQPPPTQPNPADLAGPWHQQQINQAAVQAAVQNAVQNPFQNPCS